MKVELRGIITAHHHGERIIESERRHHFHTKSRTILVLYAMKYRRRIGLRRFMQDRGESRACVFGIKIDFPGDERLMTQQSATEINAPLHMQRRMCLNLLREQLRQDNLLGEVL